MSNLRELLDTIKLRLRQSEQGQALPNAAIADRVQDMQDELSAVFQTLARCSDTLRSEAKDQAPHAGALNPDLIALADAASKHCTEAGLLTGPEHTPAPLHVSQGGCALLGKQDQFICATDVGLMPRAEQEANAARIAACFNACEGVATNDLPLVFQTLHRLVLSAYGNTQTEEALDNAHRILDARDKAQRKMKDKPC